MSIFQKLVLKALAQILLFLSNPKQISLKDRSDADDIRKEIEEELKKN